jgi:hypothetical protein
MCITSKSWGLGLGSNKSVGEINTHESEHFQRNFIIPVE